jgi:tetratricopeptide (TPR) repeat protein
MIHPFRHESKSVRLACSFVIGIVLLPSLTAAQPADSPDAGEGASSLDRGLRYYDTQQYEEAAEAFRQAYMADPKPEILYALAQAYRMSGKCERAREAYQSFLRTNPDARKAEAARVNMDRCEPKPPPQPPVTAPAPVAAAPAPTPKPQPVERDATGSSPWYTDPIGDVLTVGGLAGLTLAGVFHVIENGHESQMESAVTYGDYESSHSDANRARKITVVSGTAGGVLLVAGVVRYLTRSSDASSEVSASIDSHGGGISWLGTF